MLLLKVFLRRWRNKDKPALKVYWWRPDDATDEAFNFGDEVTADILKSLWGYSSEWTEPEDCQLIATGSILQILQSVDCRQPVKVWGSGFIKPGAPNANTSLDFYAVRGPLTAARVEASRPLALGDPGLLASLVYKRSPRKAYRVGIVTHYVDMDSALLEAIKTNPEFKLISPLGPPQAVAYDITACDLVLSSSLHGLIFADSFGVPNYWMPLSDRVMGGQYKFDDYYQSTGRQTQRIGVEVLQDPVVLKNLLHGYERVRDLKQMQRALMKSFPF